MSDSEDTCMRNLLPSLGGLLGLIFSLSGGIWCTLASLEPNMNYQIDGSTPDWVSSLPSVQFGLFSQEAVVVNGVSTTDSGTITVYTSSICVDYPSGTTRDGNWNAAYGLQITTFVLTGLVTIALLCSLCGLPFSSGAMAASGVIYILAGVLFQGLVFLFYQSSVCTANPDPSIAVMQSMGIYNTTCGLGPSGILLIIAIVCFFLTGLGCCYLSKSSKSSGDGAEHADAAAVPSGKDEEAEGLAGGD